MGIAKRCACGAVFTQRAWERLKCLGVTEDGTGKYELDWRDCPECGSTICVRSRRLPKQENGRAA